MIKGATGATEGLQSAIAFAEAHGVTAEILDKGNAILEKVVAAMKGAEKNLKGFELIAGPVGKFATLAAKGIDLVKTGIKTGEAANEEETEDPIEQLMRDDEMVDCLREIGKLGSGVGGQIVAMAWKEIPGLSLATNMIEAQTALMNMVERLTAAMEDSDIQAEAQDEGHRLEPACSGQMANRGKHLAARARAPTPRIATLNAAAGIPTLTGIDAKVGRSP